MFYRFILASALVITSLISYVENAQAQVQFSNITSGNLEANSDLKRLESTIPGKIKVSVSPGNSAQLTVLPPTFTSGASTDPNGTVKVGTAVIASTNLNSNIPDSSTTNLPVGDTDVQVGVQVQRPVAFASGTYQYSVNLIVTVTPP